jgi:hypothetical protein
MELRFSLGCKVEAGEMNKKSIATSAFLLAITSLAAAHLVLASPASAQAADAGQQVIAKRIGAIKAINGNALTLSADSGPDVAVSVDPSARILRVTPGEKDLKNASPIQVQDLKVGDTVRVRGHATADGIDALEVLVISSSAIDAARDQVREDWQKHGVGGLVDTIDPAAGTITLSIPGLAGKRTVQVHTTASTVIRRYSPDSAKPEDAKVSTLKDIQPGDQLRARGNRTGDSTDLNAEEIFTGVFPQLIGTIKSVDASSGTLSVQDLVNKKIVQLKINPDSQLHKIPAETAQKFASMFKMAKTFAANGGSSAPASASSTPGTASPTAGAPVGNAGSGAPGAGGRRSGGGMAGEFQKTLDQTPVVTLADLHKGDAVAVLATQGTPSGGNTVIKLFSGVEPILQAAPNASQAMMLSPWSLGGAPGGDASQ